MELHPDLVFAARPAASEISTIDSEARTIFGVLEETLVEEGLRYAA